MMKRLSMGLLVGALGLGSGCGSGGSGNCVNDGVIPAGEGRIICDPSGFSFVQQAPGLTANCGAPGGPLGGPCNLPAGTTTPTLSQPVPGKLCLAGTESAGGQAFLGLYFTDYSGDLTKVLKTFNADARGITQLRFTIDSPPSGGVWVDASVITSLDCQGGPLDCGTHGFTLMTAPLSNVPLNIVQPGPQVAPFVSFAQTNPAVTQTFDTSALDGFNFWVGAGAYDFCIEDFKFLDAAGNEVKP